MRARTAVVAAVAGAVVLGGTAAGVKWASSEAAAAKACDGLRAYTAQYGTIQHGRGPADVAILGDSYTAGDTLADRSQAWAYKVGGELAGVGSTGFVNGGYCGDAPYVSRIGALLADHPRVLVIQGGLNDTGEDPAKIEAAAADLLAKAKAVPRVIVVGPVDAPKRDGEARVDAALAEEVKAAGREYVSALGWHDIEYGPDGLHPTVAGHDRFAALVGQATGLTVH